MLRIALLIFSGNVTTAALNLARNLLVARLIPLEDYGIASTFAIVLAVIEMTSQMGLQQQIVQSRQGDDARYQAALQGFQLMRGFSAAILLFLGGGLVADFLNVPEAAWAYRALALVPLSQALVHFDMARISRRMNFRPTVVVQTVPAAVCLLLSWPLALWLQDYRVMLYVVVLQTSLTSALSHLMAERRFRVVFDRATMRGAIRFGWPLLLNNVLLFAVFNGDRLIVGRELGLAPLAIFSMGMTLTLTPTLVFARTCQSFFLPLLSRLDPAGRDERKFGWRASMVIELLVFSSMVFIAAVMLLWPPAVTLLLGEKYQQLLPYLGFFGMALGLRMFKIGPAIVALSVARTGNSTIGNLPRLVSLPLSWWTAVTYGDLRLILLIMMLGEVVGSAMAIGALWRRVPLQRGELLLAHAACLPYFGFVGALNYGHLEPSAGWIALGLAGGLALALVPMRALRQHLVQLVRGR